MVLVACATGAGSTRTRITFILKRSSTSATRSTNCLLARVPTRPKPRRLAARSGGGEVDMQVRWCFEGVRIMALLAWVALAGCSSPPEQTTIDAGGDCPNDLPSTCPTPVPSYAADIAPILAAKCEGCHAP